MIEEAKIGLKDSVELKRADRLAKEIIAVTGLDIFYNTRKNDYIEARSLFNFILYNSVGMSLHKIADFYRMNNKSMDHATVLHSLKNFDLYRRFSKNVDQWLNLFEATELGDSSKRALMHQYINFLQDDHLNDAYDYLKDLYYKQEKEIKQMCEKVEN